MKILPCCSPSRTSSLERKKSDEESTEDGVRRSSSGRVGGKTLASFARKLSFKSGSAKVKVDEMIRLGSGKISAEAFTFVELAKATNGFQANLLIGEGGFGRVYKGYIERINQVGISSRRFIFLFFSFSIVIHSFKHF